jgi:hypothetical protein
MRTPTWLPWALASLAVALLVSSWALAGVHSSDVFISSLALAFSAVGALVARRHPGNAMGWIFLGVGMATGLGTTASAYAERWVAGRGGSEALGETAAWYGNLSWIPFILVPCTFVPLLFPDGRLLSSRWRWVAWCAALGIAGAFVASAIHDGPIEDFPQLENPYAIDTPLIEPLTGLAVLLLLIGIAGSVTSLIVRFRRAEGERRQQIKWLALAAAIASVTVPVAAAGSDVWGEDAANFANMIAVLCLPVAAGIAILRYRLYDIDVVINRTLVYAGLTATLAAAYLGSVLLLQFALAPLTESSGLAVAASTLAVATLFSPVRLRIQMLVDRRFYRRRYDAAQTLESFVARLRDQVALDALSDDLRGVVNETVQPAHVSLWLREPDKQR